MFSAASALWPVLFVAAVAIGVVIQNWGDPNT